MPRFLPSCLLALSVTALQAAERPAVTIGDPAPAFRPTSFLAGTPFSGFDEGTAYVVEFSGTGCVPCIAEIPHLEELKKKHPSVKFVAVFSEPADDVREFLKGPGAKMTPSVACDADGTLYKGWVSDAGFVGVPQVFLVGPDGRVAWIGHPTEIDGPLARVAGGEPLDTDQRLRATLAQLSAFRSKAADERWTEAHRRNSEDVTRLVNEGKLVEAVAALDEALSEYRDLADVVEELRDRKLYLLAKVPGRREEAQSLALAVAADAFGRDEKAAGVAATLLSYDEAAIPENRIPDLPRLALILLQESRPPGDTGPENRHYEEVGTARRNYYAALARAYRLLGRKEEAVAAHRVAIRVSEDVLRRLREDAAAPEWQLRLWARVSEQLREKLPVYEKD